MLEQIVAGWPFGVATLTSNLYDSVVVVPVALAYDTPDGFAVVTPGYMDPHTAEHNFHRIEATVRQDGDEIIIDGPEWSGRIVQYEPTVEQLEVVGMALENYEAAIALQGTTIDEERERMRGILGDGLTRPLESEDW